MKMTIEELILLSHNELEKVESHPDMLLATQDLLAHSLRDLYKRYGCAVLVKKRSGQFLTPKVTAPEYVEHEIAMRAGRGETILGYAIKEG